MFLDENFMLENKAAKTLYHNYAKDMPIIDYHCHISPKEIYEDKKFSDMTDIWLGGDHYKWKAMRAFGVGEEFISGDKTSKEKFDAYAKMIPYCIGNPLFHWTQMELKKYFNVTKILNEQSKDEIFDECNLKLKNISARTLIKDSNVKVICTTDDPIDDLIYHKKLKEDKTIDFKVLPTFRPDKAINIDLDTFNLWVESLGNVENIKIANFNLFLKALDNRIDYFDSVGCKISDHSISAIDFKLDTLDNVALIFNKKINNEELSSIEVEKFKTFMLIYFGKKYSEKNWAMQLHLSALRNLSTRMFNKLGADTGFDAIDDSLFIRGIASIFDELDKENKLPKTIVYSLNPNYLTILNTMINCFQNNQRGKMQLGSAWWFNDQKEGMYEHLTSLANSGLISTFIGMLTDSRSFLSYTRHDYFRRILCNYFGRAITNEEYPEDYEFVGQIVKDICYNNALDYFNFE